MDMGAGETDMGAEDMGTGDMDMGAGEADMGAGDMDMGADDHSDENDAHDGAMDMEGMDTAAEGTMDGMETGQDSGAMDMETGHDEGATADTHDEGGDMHDEGASTDTHDEGGDAHGAEEEGIVAGEFGVVQLPLMDAHSGLMVMIDPQMIPAGEVTDITFTVTEDKVGTWTMGCFQERGQHFDDGMNGTIIVEQ
jgi:hypothetical protein